MNRKFLNFLAEVLLIAGLLLLISCKSGFEYKVAKNDGKSIEDLWIISYSQNLYGVDYDNLDCHFKIKTNTFLSSPLVKDNKIFVGDNGSKIGEWGNSIYVFDSSLKLKATIDSIPNVYRMVVFDHYLFASSMCYFGVDSNTGFKSGFSILDLDTLENVYICKELPGMISNSGIRYDYNSKLYLLTVSEHFVNKYPQMNIISTSSFDNIRTTSQYFVNLTEEFSPMSVVDGNKLWINYFELPIIEVFDLDSDIKIKQIDLRNYLSEMVNESINDVGNNVFWQNHSFVHSGIYYLSAYKRDGNNGTGSYIFMFDSSTLEFKNVVQVEKYLHYVREIKIKDEYSDIVFFNFGSSIAKVSLKTGKVEKEVYLEIY